jgi:hypothetical protein
MIMADLTSRISINNRFALTSWAIGAINRNVATLQWLAKGASNRQ